MPNFAFLSLAAVLGYAAWVLYKRSLAPPPAPVSDEAPKPAAPTELSWDDLSPVDSLGLEVGYRLIPLVDRAQGGELMARIKGVRRKLTQELGFLIPPVHIRDNLEFSPGAYRILLHGVPIGAGDIHPDRELALNPGRIPVNIDGVPTRDPAFGLDALWISPLNRARAEALGLTVVDPATVMATHVSHLVRQHAPDLLGHEEVQQLLTALGRSHAKLVEDLTPRTLQLSVIVRVLQNLLTEKVPIRQLRRIAEALLEHGPNTQDPAQLTAAVRAALGRFIVQEINGLAPELPVYTLAPALERVLQESVSGNGAALEPGLAERMHQSLLECVKRQEAVGEPTVLLVPGTVRSLIAKLTRTGIPELHVLAYHEVPDDKKLKLVGNVG
jgi:flagellar biosynthesis protein FlhA